jgi:hypothetical protein
MCGALGFELCLTDWLPHNIAVLYQRVPEEKKMFFFGKTSSIYAAHQTIISQGSKSERSDLDFLRAKWFFL